MNDILSKLTFGFLMAQLVPGAIAFYVISVPFLWIPVDSLSYFKLLTLPAPYWSESTLNIVIFLIGSTAFGMLIHGLHWSVLGALESKYNSIFDSFWHSYVIIVQIFIGPIKIIGEWFIFLTSKQIRTLRIAENIPRIEPDKLRAVELLHDFYLHFSQFYAHSSYSLTIVFFIFMSLFFKSWFSWGLMQSYDLLLFSVFIYLLAGLMFVIGRAQLASLFNAEMDIYDPQDQN